MSKGGGGKDHKAKRISDRVNWESLRDTDTLFSKLYLYIKSPYTRNTELTILNQECI